LAVAASQSTVEFLRHGQRHFQIYRLSLAYKAAMHPVETFKLI
jgi:hypothetical protein